MAFNDGEKLDGFFKEGVLHGFARCDGDDGVGAKIETILFSKGMLRAHWIC